MAVVDPIGIKVFLVKAELGLEVCLIPKYNSVSELSPAASDESLYEWVTPRNIGHLFNFLDLAPFKVGPPKPIVEQRIVVRRQVFGEIILANNLVKEVTDGTAIRTALGN